MNKIITVSREFGSGGRELGKRLAEKLGFSYYDREIIDAIAKKSNLDGEYVENVLDRCDLQNFKYTFGRTLSFSAAALQSTVDVLVAERNVILELAERNENFVIVGRSADVILREFNPLNLFVYADARSKIERCRKRMDASQEITDKKLLKEITRIDKARAKHRSLLSCTDWGDKANYHLCINTTNLEIRDLASLIAEYAVLSLNL